MPPPEPEVPAIDGTPRVLIVLNDLITGGAQRVAFDQARWLAMEGYPVELASLERIPGGAMAEACRQAGLQVHRLRRRSEPQAIAAPRLLALMRARRPGLVHTHLAIAGVVARLCARVAGVPRLAATLHNLTDWEERSGDPVRFLDRVTLRNCDAIVAVSHAIRDAALKRAPGLAGRIHVVHNGVEIARFAPDPARRARARAIHGYTPQDCVVGAVARLDRRKGIDVLLRAFAAGLERRPELRLLVAGDGAEADALDLLARELGVARQVRFAGECRDAREALAAMDVFAAPSRTEGLGIALIEALAAGLPALASAVGGLPEVVGDSGCARLLPAGEVAAWSAALVELAAAPDTRAAMAAAAIGRARAFSSERSRAALGALYERLLGREPLEAAA